MVRGETPGSVQGIVGRQHGGAVMGQIDADVAAQRFPERPELGTGRVSIVLTEELSAERNLVIVYKNMDGKYVVAQNVKRDGVNVSFDAENMVSFALVGTPDNLWIYIAAGVGGGVALILIIAIVVIVLRKKKKKNVALGQAKSPNPSRVKKSVGNTSKSH